MSEQAADAGGVDLGSAAPGLGGAAPGPGGEAPDAGGAGAGAFPGEGGGDRGDDGLPGGPGGDPSGSAPAPDWRETLSEDLRGSPALKDIGSVEDLATQLVNAQGLIGNSIRIPSENASDADRAAFRAKLLEKVPGLAEVAADDPSAFQTTMRQLGAPAEATGYRMPEIDAAGAELSEVPGFNEWAHEASLTQTQFETLARRFTESEVQAAEARAATHNADMEALHREWGYAFEEKLGAALGVAKLTNAPPDFVEAMEKNRVPAGWVRYFATLSENYGESDIGERSGEAPELTPAEAQAQLNELMNNREHDYWVAYPGTPEKQAAMDLVMKLRHRAMGKSGRAVVSTIGQEREVG